MNGTIADLFGFLAIATTLSVFIQKNQTTLIIMKVLVNMLWAVYFFLRSYWGIAASYSACAIQVVAVLRGVVALNSGKKWAAGKKWLWGFILLGWVGSIATWQGPVCWLSAISSMCATIMLWCKSAQHARCWGIVTYVTWGIYACLTSSYLALVSSAVAMISIAVGFIQYQKASTKKL